MATYPMGVGEYVDSIGSLYDWLGALIADHPHMRECGVFAMDGDCLCTAHFHWCDDDGAEVPPERATGVTLSTEELPYNPPPDVADLERREEAVRGSEIMLRTWAEDTIRGADQVLRRLAQDGT